MKIWQKLGIDDGDEDTSLKVVLDSLPGEANEDALVLLQQNGLWVSTV